jgi:hypothetical protein
METNLERARIASMKFMLHIWIHAQEIARTSVRRTYAVFVPVAHCSEMQVEYQRKIIERNFQRNVKMTVS